MKLLLPALDRFNSWFNSAAGVLQTAILCLVLAGLDATGLDHDKSGYWLLWGLTVYSAVTQPALAYSGAVNTARMDEILAKIEGLEESNAHLLHRLTTHGEPPACICTPSTKLPGSQAE